MNFLRRKSRSLSKGKSDKSLKSDFPPPPPPPPNDDDDDDDDVPPPPPPPMENGDAQASSSRLLKNVKNPVLAAEKMDSPKRGRSKDRKTKKGTMFGGKGGGGAGEKKSEEETSKSRASTSPGPPVDNELVDFTIVPILLRAGMNYEMANQYGEILKGLSGMEVDEIFTTPYSLTKDMAKCGFEVSPEIKEAIVGDLYWVKAKGKNSRKSFVYYRDTGSPSPSPGADRVTSSERSGNRSSSQMRARQSLAVGPQMVGLTEEPDEDASNPNRYKVQTRRQQAESMSKDLQDLMGTLNGLKASGGN